MKNLAIILLSSLIIIGCSSVKLDPGAHAIIVSPNKPHVDCKYYGRVMGNPGNFWTVGFATNRNLPAEAMIDLKNEANRLGANYVELEAVRDGSDDSNVTSKTNIGNAYKCSNLILTK